MTFLYFSVVHDTLSIPKFRRHLTFPYFEKCEIISCDTGGEERGRVVSLHNRYYNIRQDEEILNYLDTLLLQSEIFTNSSNLYSAKQLSLSVSPYKYNIEMRLTKCFRITDYTCRAIIHTTRPSDSQSIFLSYRGQSLF